LLGGARWLRLGLGQIGSKLLLVAFRACRVMGRDEEVAVAVLGLLAVEGIVRLGWVLDRACAHQGEVSGR
jgi:hypothetical protein